MNVLKSRFQKNAGGVLRTTGFILPLSQGLADRKMK
ncbi:hypothetical protein ACQWHJ_24620, partial [Salmonella enterica subsp. enterica serovar Infantis]